MDGSPQNKPLLLVGAGSADNKDGISGASSDYNNTATNDKEEIIMSSNNNLADDPQQDKVDFNGAEEEEEEEPETQESFTQHEMTQTGNELTQMGLFDDDDDDCNDNDGNDDDDDANSRQPMIDPLTLPWGRLMPVGSNGVVALPSSGVAGAASAAGESSTTTLGGGNNNNNTAAAAAAAADISISTTAAETSSLRPSTRGAIEMLPRSPETRTITTRSRSPSLDNGGRSSSSSNNNTNNNDNSQIDDGVVCFLGLKNLLPSDRFNDYVLGRSVKVSVFLCLTLLSVFIRLLLTNFIIYYPLSQFHRLILPPKN